MQKANFTPKKDLELYLTESYFNVFGYIELNEDPMVINLIKPLRFFNLLWHFHFTILSNKANPLKILKHLHTAKLNLPQRCYLLHRLLFSFNDVYYFTKSENHNDPNLISCLELIKCERDRLYKELYPNNIIHDNYFDFEYVRKNLAFITTYDDQISYLDSTIHQYQQCDNPYVKEDHSPGPFHVPFDKKCFLLREFIEKHHIENQTVDSAAPVIISVNPKKESMRTLITDHLMAIDALKWEYLCESKSDFHLVIDILTDFFADKKVAKDLNIKMCEGCMTNFGHALNTIYHELRPRTLKNNKDFYNLLRNLSIFKNKSNNEIYSILKS